jgi:phenylacetate-CoA ligase
MLATAINLGTLMSQAHRPPTWERRSRQLRRFAEITLTRSRFHRARLAQCGLQPRELGEPGALASLPVMEREELVNQLPDILTESDTNGCKELWTSGSSGRPLRTWISAREARVRQALHLRSRLLAGRRLFCREAVIGSFAASRGRRASSGIFGPNLYLSAHLDTTELKRELQAFGPDYLVAFPSTLLRLGDPRGISPRLITTGSEVLERDVREILEARFRAPVRDIYGAIETGLLAFQCAEGEGYHLNEDVVHFEFRPAANGAEGVYEILVTPLYGCVVPLVRYRLGDLVRLEMAPCRCGIRLPRISAIDGRSDDWLLRPDGREVPPSAIRSLFRGHDRPLQYRITQNSDATVCLELSTDAAGSKFAAQLANELRGIVGQTVELLETPSIVPEQSGKTRAIRRLAQTRTVDGGDFP